MHKSCFDKPITLEQAIRNVENNTSYCFQWFPVKTISGNILEVGGTSKEVAFEFVELNKQGQIVAYTNGFVQHVYRIKFEKSDNYSSLVLPHCQCELKWNKNLNDVIHYIEHTPDLNHTKIDVKPAYSSVVSHYDLISTF
jgi:hypothetical protein